MKFLLVMIGMLAFLSSCNNSNKNDKEEPVDSGSVFYDYKISGEEGRDSVTILLQYRYGNDEGSPLFLDSGSKVTLDGKDISADSARLSGFFYEVMLPAEEFKGEHTIVFTDEQGTEHRQEFSFLPFSLAQELPAQIKKEPFAIRLNGFTNEATPIRLVMIDTAFGTRDVNEELLVENGEFTITAKMWRALKAGPITMEIFREDEALLKSGTKQNGRLVMTYGIRREFEATDN